MHSLEHLEEITNNNNLAPYSLIALLVPNTNSDYIQQSNLEEISFCLSVKLITHAYTELRYD